MSCGSLVMSGGSVVMSGGVFVAVTMSGSDDVCSEDVLIDGSKVLKVLSATVVTSVGVSSIFWREKKTPEFAYFRSNKFKVTWLSRLLPVKQIQGHLVVKFTSGN